MKYVMFGGQLYQLNDQQYQEALHAIINGRLPALPATRLQGWPIDLTGMCPVDARRALQLHLSEPVLHGTRRTAA